MHSVVKCRIHGRKIRATWFFAFVRSFSPNTYIYQKRGGAPFHAGCDRARMCPPVPARARPCQPLTVPTRTSFFPLGHSLPAPPACFRLTTLVSIVSARARTCPHVPARVRPCPPVPVPHCPVEMRTVVAHAVPPPSSQCSLSPADETVVTMQHGRFSDWPGAHTTTHDGPPAIRARS